MKAQTGAAGPGVRPHTRRPAAGHTADRKGNPSQETGGDAGRRPHTTRRSAGAFGYGLRIPTRRTVRLLTFLAAGAVFLGFGAGSASAAILTVCPAGCDSSTVQGAVTQAAAGDTIELISSLPHTEHDISITKSVSIRGQGVDLTTIQAASSPGTAPARVFWIFPGATVTIRDIRIRYGNATNLNGGCVLNEGSLSLVDTRLSDCKASGSPNGNGGGIYNSGSLSLLRVEIHDSRSNAGGGINNSGDLDGMDCLVEDNDTTGGGTAGSAGGLYNTGGATATLTNCVIRSNSGPTFVRGGGILNNGELELIDSRVSNNSIDGIYSSGPLTVLRTSIVGNAGRGIYFKADDGSLSIRDSFIGINDQGGLRFCGSVPGHIVNTTISSNYTDGSGGGIFVCGSKRLRIANSTIADNTAAIGGSESGDGGGIYLQNPLTCNPVCLETRVDIRNSIVADNTDDSPSGFRRAHDCDGTLQSEGYNLVEQGTLSELVGTCFVDGDTSGLLVGADPQLEALTDSPGPGRTHALGPGSPAIDAGNPSGCADFLGAPLDRDQRGAPRINTCDLGAFEFGSAPPIFQDRFEP